MTTMKPLRDALLKTAMAALVLMPASSFIHAASMKMDDGGDGMIKAFYHEEDVTGMDVVIKGKVLSLGTREDMEKDALTRHVQDRTKAGVRLYGSEGIRPGDTLFVINDKNLVVARLTVKSVFYTQSFGYMMVGYGSLRFAKQGYRVVQKVEDRHSRYAYIHKSRGDYYRETGQTAESIREYKKALELDKGSPEAHMELGYIYLKENLLQFAFKEFSEAYKSMGRLYDNEDKFMLLKGLTETRYREAYAEDLPKPLRRRYIQEGIKYGKEALQLYPDSTDVNFFLGTFYFRSAEPSDVDARNHFQKVVELDPENIDACLALAELYYNHKNLDKARMYAESARKIDPANERARFILKQIEGE